MLKDGHVILKQASNLPDLYMTFHRMGADLPMVVRAALQSAGSQDDFGELTAALINEGNKQKFNRFHKVSVSLAKPTVLNYYMIGIDFTKKSIDTINFQNKLHNTRTFTKFLELHPQDTTWHFLTGGMVAANHDNFNILK